MAQQNAIEDTSTDFSGLASSLLPPLSGWTREKWQNFTGSHNAHDTQDVRRPFSITSTGAPYQNGLMDSSYGPYNPNEFGTADHALSSGEISGSASVAPSDSAQVQFYQVCPAGCCSASLTDSAGDEQQRLCN